MIGKIARENGGNVQPAANITVGGIHAVRQTLSQSRDFIGDHRRAAFNEERHHGEIHLNLFRERLHRVEHTAALAMIAQHVDGNAARGVHPESAIVGHLLHDRGYGVVLHRDDVKVGIGDYFAEVGSSQLAANSRSKSRGISKSAAENLRNFVLLGESFSEIYSHISGTNNDNAHHFSMSCGIHLPMCTRSQSIFSGLKGLRSSSLCPRVMMQSTGRSAGISRRAFT